MKPLPAYALLLLLGACQPSPTTPPAPLAPPALPKPTPSPAPDQKPGMPLAPRTETSGGVQGLLQVRGPGPRESGAATRT